MDLTWPICYATDPEVAPFIERQALRDYTELSVLDFEIILTVSRSIGLSYSTQADREAFRAYRWNLNL